MAVRLFVSFDIFFFCHAHCSSFSAFVFVLSICFADVDILELKETEKIMMILKMRCLKTKALLEVNAALM